MKLIFLNFLALLLAYASSFNWQSAGNMSSSNMTVIHSYIDANFSMGTENATTLSLRPRPFSDYLNNLWAPAWNVVILLADTQNQNFDAVLYGYAFRDHWLWINGLKFQIFTQILFNYGSIIIWKDYNCKGWLDINTYSSVINTFTPDPTTAIKTSFQSYPPKYDDIWNLAWKTVINLETVATNFKGDHAYTMIVSQSIDNFYFGRVCASNYNIRTNNPLGSDAPYINWGSYLIIQIR